MSLAVAKRKGANAVRVAEDAVKRVDAIKGRIVPAGLDVTVTRNYGETANDKANELLFHLALATASIVILITATIGWREGVVVLIIIPTTILLTLFASWMMGYTINRVSLFALIFSIGILVDDAIVVVENIVRHWSMRGSRGLVETAVEAVAEVGNPTIVATLAIIAALLPMMFVSGLMGPYMSPIPANASIAMLFSFFVAVTVTPWLLLRLAGRRFAAMPAGDESHHDIGAMGRFYIRIAKPLLKGRIRSKIFLISVGLATVAVCALFGAKGVVVKLLPFDNKSEIQVIVDLPKGSSLEETDRVLMAAADRLADLPELTSIQAYAGTAAPFNFNGLVRHYYLRSEPQMGDLSVNLKPKGDRSRASHTIALDIRKRLADVALPPHGSIKVVEVPPGPPVLSTLLAEVYGPDAATRRELASKVRKAFEAVDFVVDVDDSYGAPGERLRFAIDQEALEFHGVAEQAVYDTIGALVGGTRVGYSQRGSGLKPILINVALPHSALTLSQRILSTPLPAGGTTRQGANVELGDVVTLKREVSSYPIFRHNGRFAEMVTGELAGRFEAPIYGMLAVDDKIAGMDWGGSEKPDNHVSRPAARRIEADPALGRRVGGDLRDLPRHGGRLRRRHPRNLSPGGCAIWIVRSAARRADAGAADPDRNRARPLGSGRGVHGDVDDRLHRAGRHHRAQLDPAGRFHSRPARSGRRPAPGADRGRSDALQADCPDSGGGHDRRGVHTDRSDLPGTRHFAGLRPRVFDCPDAAGHPGNVCLAAGRRDACKNDRRARCGLICRACDGLIEHVGRRPSRLRPPLRARLPQQPLHRRKHPPNDDLHP